VTLSEEHAHYDKEQREPLVRPERGLEYDDAEACRSQYLGALDHVQHYCAQVLCRHELQIVADGIVART